MALLFPAVAVVLVPTLVLALEADEQGPVAVLVNPFGPASAAAVVAASGGLLLRSTMLDWLVVATSEDPAFRRHLQQSGAWLVLRPLAAFGCDPHA